MDNDWIERDWAGPSVTLSSMGGKSARSRRGSLGGCRKSFRSMN
jgi:hypothetical protein